MSAPKPVSFHHWTVAIPFCAMSARNRITGKLMVLVVVVLASAKTILVHLISHIVSFIIHMHRLGAPEPPHPPSSPPPRPQPPRLHHPLAVAGAVRGGVHPAAAKIAKNKRVDVVIIIITTTTTTITTTITKPTIAGPVTMRTRPTTPDVAATRKKVADTNERALHRGTKSSCSIVWGREIPMPNDLYNVVPWRPFCRVV